MKSVLVVDDEQSLVLAIELILSTEYRVFKAASGEEALIQVKDCKPGLILLDIMMPGLGGLETLKMLKAHPDFRNVPVVIMSGARPLVKQSEYRWTDFLTKPFNADQLQAVIKAHIG